MPDVETITTTKVIFTDSEMDHLSTLWVQLNNFLQSGTSECTGEEYALIVASLQACLDDVSV